jgi:hypothetical protein
MGHLSSIAPFLYNEEGKGWKFKQGGLLDLTGRGTIGFGLDIPLDPTTYLSFGAGPLARVLVTKGGRVVGKQALSKKGFKAVGEAYEHELPEATRLAERILRNMRKRSTPTPRPEEVASVGGLARKSTSRTRLEGALDLAKRELKSADDMLRQEPLDAVRMAAQQRAAEKVAHFDQLLNTRNVVEEFAARPIPSSIHSGLTGVDGTEALQFAREARVLGSEIAHQNAISQVHDLIQRGAHKYANDSVVRFAGKTLLTKEMFKAVGTPTSRFLRAAGELPPAAQIMAGIKKINDSRGVKAITHGIDSMFNETLKAARRVPGALEARTLFRAENRNFRRMNLESVGKLTKGMMKQKLKEPADFFGRPIATVGEYVSLHLDDPARFPKNNLPPAVQDEIPRIRAMTAEWFRNEARAEAIDPRAWRDNYFTHIFDNTDDEIKQLSEGWTRERGIPFDKTFMLGPWKESRVFPTLTDAMEYAQRLKNEGIINFDLKPVLNVSEVLAKRGDSNAVTMAASRYHTRILNHMGLSPEQVADETFRRTFPEIAQKLKAVAEEGLGESLGEQTILQRLFPGDEAYQVGRLLAEKPAIGAKEIGRYSPQVQALYWMGRAQEAQSLPELERLLRAHADELSTVDPKVLEDIRNIIGIGRRRFLSEFNEPYARIDSGPYQGMYLPKAMAEEAARIGTTIVNRKEVGQLLKTFDIGQDIFKTWITSVFPAFHIRNAMSNLATTFTDIGLAAFNPRRVTQVAAIMLGQDGTLLSEGGRRYTHAEIRNLFERYGLGTPETALADTVGRHFKKNILVENPATKVGRKVGQKVEDNAKLLNFVTHLERGLDPATAAERVHGTLFDYEQLAPFERDVLRRLFPFYTWTSKNLRLVAKQIVQHPGRVKAQLALNDQDRGPEREMLPNYLRGDFKLKLRNDGKLTYVTGLDLPITSAIEQVFGSSGHTAVQQNLAAINPFLKTAVEVGFRRNLWTGRSLDERQALGTMGSNVIKRLPPQIQNYLEFREEMTPEGPAYEMNGLKAYLLFKSYFLARIFSTDVKHASNDEKSFLVDFFTGVDLKEYDLSEAQGRILRNRVREMEEELVRRGVMKKGRPYLPKTSPYQEALPKKPKKERNRRFGP